MNINFLRIDKNIDVSQFVCSSKPLTIYLKKYALDNDARNLSRCIIALCDDVVVGAGSVVTKDILLPGVYMGNPARVQPQE